MRLPFAEGTDAPNDRAISFLPIDIIHPNPYQPRTHFDTLALEELCASIKAFGILQPITVRRFAGIYEVVAGERRLRAAKMAGLTSVPAVVVQLDEEGSALVALLENLQRCDLTFLEEAEGYEKLVRLHGLTQEQIAEKIGKTQSSVANKLRLLKLPGIVKKKIREHALTERHARALLRLSEDEKLQYEILEQIIARSLNVRQSETLIDRALCEKNTAEKKALRRMHADFKVASNTLKQAVQLICDTGIPAVLHEKQTESSIEYTVIRPLPKTTV